MGRTSTFYEYRPETKAKWERLARLSASVAWHDGDGDRSFTRDEIIGHIQEALRDEGSDLDGRLGGMYLERMRMASVFSGPSEPTLDLVLCQGGGLAYRWLRQGEIPAGFLGHILSITSAMPRHVFDYFVLMAKDYSLEELTGAVGPGHAMLLLLLAEFYVRVKRVSEFTATELEDYLIDIALFKSEVQSKITRAECDGFNAMIAGLLLTNGR